jgi:hypothetical protein
LIHRKIADRGWGKVLIAAPGPSLAHTVDIVTDSLVWPAGPETCAFFVCQDAYRLFPWADILYGCDNRWWHNSKGAPEFQGERWASHRDLNGPQDPDHKIEVAEKYVVELVYGKEDGDRGFSMDPTFIFYGSNSGFQTINLAILMGAREIGLIGYDMAYRNQKAHFFDRQGLSTGQYEDFVLNFDRAAHFLQDGISITNFTPGSAMKSFPMGGLDDLAAFLER